MEKFVNATDIMKLYNSANPDSPIGYPTARKLFKQIRERYGEVILPSKTRIPLCWVEEQMGDVYRRKSTKKGG